MLNSRWRACGCSVVMGKQGVFTLPAWRDVMDGTATGVARFAGRSGAAPALGPRVGPSGPRPPGGHRVAQMGLNGPNGARRPTRWLRCWPGGGARAGRGAKYWLPIHPAGADRNPRPRWRHVPRPGPLSPRQPAALPVPNGPAGAARYHHFTSLTRPVPSRLIAFLRRWPPMAATGPAARRSYCRWRREAARPRGRESASKPAEAGGARTRA